LSRRGGVARDAAATDAAARTLAPRRPERPAGAADRGGLCHNRAMADRQPTEQELRARLEEELKRVRVDQVVLEATVSILNVAAIRAGLGPGGEQERDLDQVRVGIDAVRALLPVVEQVSGEQARPLRDALAQLQMTYVRAVGAE